MTISHLRLGSGWRLRIVETSAPIRSKASALSNVQKVYDYERDDIFIFILRYICISDISVVRILWLL